MNINHIKSRKGTITRFICNVSHIYQYEIQEWLLNFLTVISLNLRSDSLSNGSISRRAGKPKLGDLFDSFWGYVAEDKNGTLFCYWMMWSTLRSLGQSTREIR